MNWGKGYYLKAYTDLKDLRVKAAWWTNNSYVPLLANPFFNTMSVDEPGTMFDSTGMFCLGLEYARRLGAGIHWELMLISICTSNTAGLH